MRTRLSYAPKCARARFAFTGFFLFPSLVRRISPSANMGDDAALHKLCQSGELERIKEFVTHSPDKVTLEDRLANRKGVFGYTPLHEAVASGHHGVLDYLLVKAGDSHVNCRANSGYTPMHLAASSGHVECVRVLLRHNADIGVVDEYGKTPKQTAELSSKMSIVRVLRGAEILREVRNNGDNLSELLQQASNEQLESNCLNEALTAAVQNDHHQNVGKLIVKGATNISEALKLSVNEKKIHASAMLMLVYAAMDGNCNLIRQLFDEIRIEDQPCQECSKSSGGTYALVSRMLNQSTTDEDCRECLQSVQQVLKNSNMPTTIPIEIARRNITGQTSAQRAKRCAHVREELLMKTNVNKEGKYVYWKGLGLRSIEINWLKRVDWVKILQIGRNQLKSLPPQIGAHLKQVTKLEIEHNELEKIPGDLLQLPCVVELNLSHNLIHDLPNVMQWSPSLTTLNLSHNNLRSFPEVIEAPAMLQLSIASNQFRSVPKSICSFSHLQSLDISSNQDILVLPVEMGRLSQLTNLNLKNLRDLHDPPRAVQGDARDCIEYLKHKLQNVKEFYKMKLMLVGHAERGKSTLVAALQRADYTGIHTVGVEVSDWGYRPRFNKPTFHFSIWDFGGQEEYYSTHQCFLSRRSMYLLVFNLKHGDKGVEELKPWLNNIQLRAPWSLVIIVGTHLDKIKGAEKTTVVNGIMQKVKRLTQGYQKLVIPEIVPVALQPPLENVPLLRDTIYKHAAEYKYNKKLVMGQQIPASYHKLDRQLQLLREDVRRERGQPILHHEQFKNLVEQMNMGIHSDAELRTATIFLRDVGTLLHYDDKRHNLHELYFIDPHWLCKMMARVVGPELGKQKGIRNGILEKEKILEVLSTPGSEKYVKQYLTLLYRFEIALPLNETKVLVTSMLKPDRPENNIDIEVSHDPPFHTRYITFGSAATPPGFWSRYLSRIMYSISQASTALELDTLPHTCIDSMSLGLDDDEDIETSTNVTKVQYWENGLFFNGRDVAFRVESLSESRMKYMTEEHGIFMVASPYCPKYPNNEGVRITCQLVDMALSLLRDMYPGLTEIKQRIPCYECVHMRRQDPYEFTAEECWAAAMEKQETMIECKFDRQDPTKNHTMVVSKIVPDMFLEDIDPNFLLNKSQIKNEEMVLTRPTEYEKICQGVLRGSFVTIMYPYKSKEDLSKVRSEVRILQKWHHPCLTCLMGVVVHPRVAVVMEKAPENSLEWPLLKKQVPIHRVTIFRIAAQVTAALKFLHKNRILFRDLKASNVLVWTLDHESLCHCKLANYALSTQLNPTKAKAEKGFIAPEVLHMGNSTRYNEMADIFSFGMLLYQMISRKDPYHESNEGRTSVHAALHKGERPKLPKDSYATMSFYYLKLAMEASWDGSPQKRPSAESLVEYTCLSSVQSVMSIITTRDASSMRQAVVVKTQRCNDIWVCSDGIDGLEIDVYNLSTFAKTKTQRIPSIFSAICPCKDYVWIATRNSVTKKTSLEVYNPSSLKRELQIKNWELMVSCISCSKENVYIGTSDGLCFSYPIDLKRLKHNSNPQKKEFPETKPIDDILQVEYGGTRTLWVSHTRYIYFLQPETLEMENVQYRGDTDDLVGRLYKSLHDLSLVWSAHVGGTMLSAWDVQSRTIRFEVNTSKKLDEIYSNPRGGQSAITAIAPALDTVWVGMTSGHILVFSNQELLTWYHPYSSYVQFITVIPGTGPCKTERCLLLSGGQRFLQLIPEKHKEIRKISPPVSGAVMVLFEAFDKKVTKQVRFIETKSSELFDNFHTLRSNLKIEELGFKDGTHILPEENFIVHLFAKEKEVFEVSCPKPLRLTTLLDKIQRKVDVPDLTLRLEYRNEESGECIEIHSQRDLEKYVRIKDRPELICHLGPFLAD